MRVVVAGGGIGGLSLAQGLRRGGAEVVVLERDIDLSRTGGYKLHLGPSACAALEALLPPPSWAALAASAVLTSGFRIAARDHRGRLLGRGSDESDGRSMDLDRITLRLLLAEGLGDRLRTGRTYRAHRREGDRVVVETTDGQTVTGDVLVAADGSGSSVVATETGAPAAEPTGLVGIAGRAPWACVPPGGRRLLRDEPTLAIGPGGTGMFASRHAPPRDGRGGVPSHAFTTEPVVIWGLITLARHLPARPGDLTPEDLTDLAVRLLRRHRWSPDLVGVPQASWRHGVASFRFLAADPGRLATWCRGPVTGIGDAVHAMPPTGGRGAATAILDAARLTTALQSTDGAADIPSRLRAYEARMRAYAAPALRESLEPVRWIEAAGTPLGQAAARLALPAWAGARAAVATVVGRRR